ncbi:MAG: hypothetical protein GEV09_12085 [Pseudonocardiaceae bacterium]|nr:hypothetical protein [Pseudonocardiaceae bacterium]
MSLFPQTRAALELADSRPGGDAGAALQILKQCDTASQAGGDIPLPLLIAAIRVVVGTEWLAHRGGDADVIAFHTLGDTRTGLGARSADEADETLSRLLRARFAPDH